MAKSKTEQIQAEVINFFRTESSQNKVSFWVYIFNILRYFFNPKNMWTAIFLASLYFGGSFAYQQFREYSANNKIVELKEAEDKIVVTNQIFSQVLQMQKTSDYLPLVEAVEKDIQDTFKTHANLIIKSSASKSHQQKLLENAQARHNQITSMIGEDKEAFTLLIDSAQMNNSSIHKISPKNLVKQYQRLTMYKTKNYHSLFQHNYSKTYNEIVELKRNNFNQD